MLTKSRRNIAWIRSMSCVCVSLRHEDCRDGGLNRSRYLCYCRFFSLSCCSSINSSWRCHCQRSPHTHHHDTKLCLRAYHCLDRDACSFSAAAAVVAVPVTSTMFHTQRRRQRPKTQPRRRWWWRWTFVGTTQRTIQHMPCNRALV
jgi:hypothetical protein